MTAMHTLFRRLLVLVFALIGICSAPVGAAPAAPAEPVEADRIVAVVGDEVITLYDLRIRLDAALKQLQKQGTSLPPQDILERQLLERVIMDRIQMQFARDSGLRIDDNQLDQAIGRIAGNNKMTPQQFRQALEKDGINYARFREEIRGEMTMMRLREREVDSKLVISDGEIDLYLANQSATGGGEDGLGTVTGILPSRTGGTLTLVQKLGDLDALADYSFDGRQVVIRHGGTSPRYGKLAYSDFKQVFNGEIAGQPLIGVDQVTFQLANRDARFEFPIQDRKYHGGNYALLYDGVNDATDCGTGATFNFTSGAFTVEFWIRVEAYPAAVQRVTAAGVPVKTRSPALSSNRRERRASISGTLKIICAMSDCWRS